jgi:hypothetical protein
VPGLQKAHVNSVGFLLSMLFHALKKESMLAHRLLFFWLKTISTASGCLSVLALASKILGLMRSKENFENFFLPHPVRFLTNTAPHLPNGDAKIRSPQPAFIYPAFIYIDATRSQRITKSAPGPMN